MKNQTVNSKVKLLLFTQLNVGGIWFYYMMRHLVLTILDQYCV